MYRDKKSHIATVRFEIGEFHSAPVRIRYESQDIITKIELPVEFLTNQKRVKVLVTRANLLDETIFVPFGSFFLNIDKLAE